VPCFGAGLQLTPENQAAVRRVYDECRQVAPFVLEGDYYPLTRYSRASSEWIAWQFNRPEQGDGVVQAFRREGAPVEEMRFKIRGLDPNAVYELTDFDKTDKFKMSGRELMVTGLPVKLPPRGSAIFTYARLTAVIEADPAIGEQPLPVCFDGAKSRCASGKIASFDWGFGDGTREFENMALIKKDGYTVYRLRFGNSLLEIVPELGSNAIRLMQKIGDKEYEVLEAPRDIKRLATMKEPVRSFLFGTPVLFPWSNVWPEEIDVEGKTGNAEISARFPESGLQLRLRMDSRFKHTALLLIYKLPGKADNKTLDDLWPDRESVVSFEPYTSSVFAAEAAAKGLPWADAVFLKPGEAFHGTVSFGLSALSSAK